MNIAMTVYGRNEAIEESDLAFAAEHADLVIVNDVGVADRLRRHNPLVTILSYFMSWYWDEWMNHQPIERGLGPEEWCRRHAVDYERMFLHYLRPLHVRACDGVTTRFHAPVARREYTEWMAQWCAARAVGCDGIFLDNAIIDAARIASIRLYDTDDYLDLPATDYHPRIRQNFELIELVRLGLVNAIGSEAVVMANLNALFRSVYFPWRRHANVLADDGMIEAWFPMTRADVADGSPYAAFYSGAATTVAYDLRRYENRRVYWSKEKYPSDRGRMLALAWYHAVTDGEGWFAYSPREIVGLPTAAQWFPAMTVDLGEAKPLAIEGTLFRREFELATVVVRLRHGVGDPVGPETGQTIHVSGRPLLVGGGVGEPVNQITLRSNEGAILMKE